MKVFVTGRVPDTIKNSLEATFDLKYHDSLVPLKEDEILEGAKECDAILCPLSDKITEKILRANPQLKIIANYGAGFDNINLEVAKELGIIVTNAPAPSSAVSTAELTLALILALSRRLFPGEKMLRRGEFHGWRPTLGLGYELRGKTLGIFGLGNIGREVAKRAEAFGMNIIYTSRSKKETPSSWTLVEWEQLVEDSDILTLHTAYSPQLHHMVNEDTFKKMKSSAYLINAARGPLVCEADLIAALEAGDIAGAALDVYEFEPKFSEKLLELDNVALAPHLGNATYEAREEMGKAAFENLLAVKDGKPAPNKVN